MARCYLTGVGMSLDGAFVLDLTVAHRVMRELRERLGTLERLTDQLGEKDRVTIRRRGSLESHTRDDRRVVSKTVAQALGEACADVDLFGVAQGSPLSPLLANVYLDPLDRHFEERRINFVRYADDILVFAEDEARALDALRGMADFLHDPLHLSLKPAKTNHVRIAAGVDFLGFRSTGATLTIQPEKLDHVTSALHGLAAVLGAPHTSFLERTRTLGRINSLIRGVRAYFALPDEPLVIPQLRHLDRVTERLGEELLSPELRSDPAWQMRERFAAPPERTRRAASCKRPIGRSARRAARRAGSSRLNIPCQALPRPRSRHRRSMGRPPMPTFLLSALQSSNPKAVSA